MSEMTATTHRRRGGVFVKSVVADSLADQCGLEPGDKIYAINEHVIPDSLSFSFNIVMPELVMEIHKADGEVWELEVENDGEPFGVALEEDPIMLCRNKCIFCFVDQNPKGYRKSLLIKDEDIRLSFMYGNYSTLSSTDEAETERIIREKIQPLYVSVHATDPATRVFMLKNKRTGDILDRLKHFAANGIDFHTQIVLCPEINDGDILAKTLEELGSLYPMTRSIAVVPLGITEHRKNLINLKEVSDAYCRETIEFVKPFQERFMQQFGYPVIFLGDEFYIRAGYRIPSRKVYRDFPQMENGIGMVRRFIDSFKRNFKRSEMPRGLRATLVTGSLFGPVLQDMVALLNQYWGTDIQVVPVRNDSFGANLINVAGLVHARDTIDQLKGRDLGAFVLIPEVMVKDREDMILIDNLYPQDMAAELKVPVVLSGNTGTDLLRTLRNWPAHVVADKDAKPSKSCGSSHAMAV